MEAHSNSSAVGISLYFLDVEPPDIRGELLKAKAYIDSLPKEPMIEIWVSEWCPGGQITKMPAIQWEGRRIALSPFADEIWLINEDDFNAVELTDKESDDFIFPVFRNGVRVYNNKHFLNYEKGCIGWEKKKKKA